MVTKQVEDLALDMSMEGRLSVGDDKWVDVWLAMFGSSFQITWMFYHEVEIKAII